jgi:hypothetical protein
MKKAALAILLSLFSAGNSYAAAGGAQKDYATIPASSSSIVATSLPVFTANFGSFSGGLAGGLSVNAFGSPSPSYTASQFTDPTLGSVQLFNVSSQGGGEADLIGPIWASYDGHYKAIFQLRSDTPATVNIFLRTSGAPFDDFAVQTVNLTSAWQTFTVDGWFEQINTGSAGIRITPVTLNSNIYIAQMSAVQLNDNSLVPQAGAVANTLFGMIVQDFGTYTTWPSTPGYYTNFIRLWDTGTDWNDIEASSGTFNFSKIDSFVAFAQLHSGDIMLTLGQTPSWASSNPSQTGCAYFVGCSVPSNTTDWSAYVTALAARYGTSIKYWELWNEPDYSGFWVGTAAQLEALYAVAYPIIHAANPNAIVIGPSVTNLGLAFFDQFLQAGGGVYVDAFSFHGYYDSGTELLASYKYRMAETASAFGYNKPIWNTEGAPTCNSQNQNCTTYNPSGNQLNSPPVRSFMIDAAQGLAGWSYYVFEDTPVWSALTTGAPFTTPTAMGAYYAAAINYLKGATVTDSYCYQDICAVFFAGNKAAVWSTVDNTTVVLPSAWTYTQQTPINGSTTSIPANKQVILNTIPLLLM